MRFSKTTGCFYPEAITYQSLPADLIVVKQADFDAAIARPAGATLDVQGGVLVIVTAPLSTAAQLLAKAQQAQLDIIGAAYQAAAAAPVSFTTASGLAKTFQADAQSVANLSGSLLSFTASTLPTGFYWVAADNTQAPFTYADLQGLAAAIAASSWTAFQRLQGAKAAINSATTTAAVQAVVF